tara:strand:+ start:885 stop:1811 length:927 start_codon:yes stop_codon:yes gene_type:complete
VKTRILLDTDANNEIDDQQAIAYLLLSGESFLVEGITVNCTDNGGDIEAQAEEAERIVKFCGLHNQLKVTRGASGSFEKISKDVFQEHFDGIDAVNLIIDRASRPEKQKLVLLAIGKLTNVALALKKKPTIAEKLKIVWLGSNYPEPGEYNLINDQESVNFVLDSEVDLEIAVVRYFSKSGTGAVRVTPEALKKNIAGKGPWIKDGVVGRHGGVFHYFGDYSINLLNNTHLYGDPPSRALYDMAAAAIVKNSRWSSEITIPAPMLNNGNWLKRPDNKRMITIKENFNEEAIVKDFYSTINQFIPAKIL